MDPKVVEGAVRVLHYAPFLANGVLVVLSRTLIAPRHLRAGVTFGCASGLGMVAWLARYFLEQRAPTPFYDAPTDVASVLAVTAPSLAYDILTAVGMLVAFGAVSVLLPADARQGDKT